MVDIIKEHIYPLIGYFELSKSQLSIYLKIYFRIKDLNLKL